MKTTRSGSRGRLLLGVLAACTSACGVLLAQGLIRVYDQTNDPDPLPAHDWGGVDVRTNAPLGQSFVPTLDRVDFVEVLFSAGGTPLDEPRQTLQLNLRAGTITGPVVGSTAPVVLLWQGQPGRLVQEFVFPAPVSIIPGDPYMLEIVHVSGGDHFRPVYLTTHSTSKPDYYLRGGWVYKGMYADSPDFWFREGMIIPEPSTAVLLACGALGLAAAVRRRS